MSTDGRTPRIEVPRWIQLVGLPILLVLAWVVATAAGHVVFLFLIAALVALLLDPLVRALQRARLPRGVSVAVVYLSFAAALVLVIVAVATAVVGQTTTAANRFNGYFTNRHGSTGQTSADRDVDRLQHWLNTHHLKSVHVQKRGHKLVRQIQQRDVGKYTHKIVTFVEGAAISIGKTLFSLVLLIVVSVYMLLDMQRFGRAIDRRYPPRPGEATLLRSMEHALASYVRGQALLSVIIGTSAGFGLWVLAALGLLPHAQQYALLFGVIVAVTEVIPYLGPWLGAIPPLVYGAVVHPISALWVALLFLAIHQIEGHVVVPNVMGNALRLHPLLVIFGLAAGAEVYGLPGALVALPLLAVARAIWEFFADRIKLEPWTADDLPPEVELAKDTYPSPVSSFPVTRLRRLRRTGQLRALVRETTLSVDDLVMPLFVAPAALPHERLPALGRHSVETVVRECEELVAHGVTSVILFGLPEDKDDEGSGAWIDDGVVQRALRSLRPRFPELLLLTDVCLCEYTSHGHCGVIGSDGEVDNDASLELIARTAVSHVEAGADAVCPSDMMDGRVGAIREVLPQTPIVSYSAKYASAFYGPFREVADSAPAFGDRRGYQLDPGNVREALRECEQDVAEGADMLMVKPALPYLDVVRAVRERFDLPLAAYNVSGEYAMVKAAAAAGDLDERAAAIESLTAIRRAGADVVLTYWAKELASWQS